MGVWAGVPSGDRDLDARRNERLSWHRLVETLEALADTPPDRADLQRRRYENAKGIWWRMFLRLDQVRGQAA